MTKKETPRNDILVVSFNSLEVYASHVDNFPLLIDKFIVFSKEFLIKNNASD